MEVRDIVRGDCYLFSVGNGSYGNGTVTYLDTKKSGQNILYNFYDGPCKYISSEEASATALGKGSIMHLTEANVRKHIRKIQQID